MKTYKTILILTVILICLNSTIYSQADSIKTFYTKGFSISYTTGFMNVFDDATKKNKRIPDINTIDDFNKLIFIGDSVLKITTEENSNILLNLNTINKISYENGSKTWAGIGIGAGIGAALGFLLGVLLGDDEPGIGSFSAAEKGVALGILGIPIGGIFGGLIGANTPAYEKSYNIGKVKENKKDELIKFLNTNSNK